MYFSAVCVFHPYAGPGVRAPPSVEPASQVAPASSSVIGRCFLSKMSRVYAFSVRDWSKRAFYSKNEKWGLRVVHGRALLRDSVFAGKSPFSVNLRNYKQHVWTW